MAASVNTRFHESGHALVAYRLGMLHENGMILNSDSDAFVCVVEENDGTRSWAVRRVAIKLAGPLGRILHQGEALEWDTMRQKGEYARDFEEAKRTALIALGLNPLSGQSDEADLLMDEACRLARGYLLDAPGTLTKLTEATAGVDAFSASQIEAVIRGYEQECSTEV